MLGFMKMYEVKKENALQELSHKLQQSEKFKTEHTFWINNKWITRQLNASSSLTDLLSSTEQNQSSKIFI